MSRADEEGVWGQPRKAYPCQVAKKGRGLVARVALAPGEEVERCCCIPIGPGVWSFLNENSPLGDYYFAHPEEGEDGMIILGLLSLANHAEEGNADILWEKDEALGWIARLVANSAIAVGEEITHRYRCGAWFEVVGA